MYKKIIVSFFLVFSFFAIIKPVTASAAYCSTDADCGSGQYCYQPPMPECPAGMACIQVMPAKYCANTVDACQKDANGRNICATWDPMPGFCSDGTLIEGGVNECGCSLPPTCERERIIIGDTLPSGINYIPITTDSRYPTIYSLRNFMPKVQSPTGETGYGMGFSFEGLQGEMLESLVSEMEIASVGSYIRTHLYGPDNRRITSADTRIDFTISQPGTFHLIATTFGDKQGDISVQVFDREAQKLKGSQIAQSLDAIVPPQPLPTYGTNVINIGRLPFSLSLEFPDTVYIKDGGVVEYFSKEAARTIKVRPTVFRDTSSSIINKVNSRTGISPLPINLSQLGERTLIIRPATLDLFSAGYYYGFISDLVFDQPGVTGMNFYTYFAAISPSGKLADLNDDGRVNLADFTILAREFMTNTSLYQADINGDGRVNLIDYTLLAQEFGNN